MASTITATAGMESSIQSPTPPGQPWSSCDDWILPCSSYPPQNSRRYTKGPIPQRFLQSPSGEKQRHLFDCPFRKLPTINQESAHPKLLTTWDSVCHHVMRQNFLKGPSRALMREKHLPESTLKIVRRIELEVRNLYLLAESFSTDTEDEPLVWFMKNEILLEKLYERLRFLCYRLAVYAIACLWSYSEFPGRIRPPCTTMPWTIWPALIVLWGVCWMFYPSPGRAPGAGEFETQSHLHQPQPEELGGDFLFSASDEVDLIPPLLEDSLSSDEWWAPYQLNTICDSLAMTMDHDTGAYPPHSARQFSPMTTVDPTRSPTSSLHPGSGSQLTLSHGVQQRSQSQGGEPVAVGITENIATTTSGSKATNRFQCPQCYKVLSRRDALDRHQRSQHNRGVEEHLCPHKPCKHSRQGSGFVRRDGLRRHLKACKSRPRRAITVALDSMDSQPDSENETRRGSQVRSPDHHAHSSERPNDTSDQQSSADSLILKLRKSLAEAEVARDRAKREYEEAQQKVANYKVTIETLEKERTT